MEMGWAHHLSFSLTKHGLGTIKLGGELVVHAGLYNLYLCLPPLGFTMDFMTFVGKL